MIKIKKLYQKRLGPVYTKRQHERCSNSAMALAILFSLKTMVSLQNGFAIKPVSLALTQYWRLV